MTVNKSIVLEEDGLSCKLLRKALKIFVSNIKMDVLSVV